MIQNSDTEEEHPIYNLSRQYERKPENRSRWCTIERICLLFLLVFDVYFFYLNFEDIFYSDSTKLSDSDKLLVAQTSLESKKNELLHVKQQLAQARITNSQINKESQNPSKNLQASQILPQPISVEVVTDSPQSSGAVNSEAPIYNPQYVLMHNIKLEKNKITFFNLPDDVFNGIKAVNRDINVWGGMPEKWHFEYENSKLMFNDVRKNCHQISDTVLLMSPHHTDNLWHYHNDLVIPAFFQLLSSGSLYDENKQIWFFKEFKGRVQKSTEFWPELEVIFEKVVHNFRNMQFPICLDKFLKVNEPARPWFNVAPAYGLEGWHYDLARKWQDYLWERLGKAELWRKRKKEICQWFSKGKKPKMVYVRRNDYRSVTNFKEILPYFQKYFDVFVMDSWNRVDGTKPVSESAKQRMWERLDLLSQTNIVIGPHGSGLAHAIFMPPDQTVLVRLVVQYFNSPFVFQNMAHYTNVHYYAVDLVGRDGKEQPTGNAIFPKDRAEKAAEAAFDRVTKHCHICEMKPDSETKPTELQSIDQESCHFHLCAEGTPKANQYVQCNEPSEDGCRCGDPRYQT